MRLMHTPLPDFYRQMEAAAKRERPDTEVVIRGLEGFRTGKLASLRTGRMEHEIWELTQDEDIARVELAACHYNPELYLNFVIKGYRKDGTCAKAFLENMYITLPGIECELYDAEVIEDRRHIDTNDVEGTIIRKED